MRYLITTATAPPFLTDFFDAENNFNPDLMMAVYDLHRLAYTTDGVNWKDLPIDHL
jgi:hypothetical protein